MSNSIVFFAAFALFANSIAQDFDEGEAEEFVSTQIHSDLPLYTFEWEDLWPRNFRSETSFGCSSRVRFGDWKFTPNPADEYGYEHWIRINNYGVVHCAANFRSADDQTELEDGYFERGYFVRLGTTERSGRTIELWAIQTGTVPGSDYILLSRAASDDAVTQFDVLQVRCPPSKLRSVEGEFDVWLTSYCAINSRDDLLALAVAMLDFPPYESLAFIPPPEPDSDGGNENE